MRESFLGRIQYTPKTKSFKYLNDEGQYKKKTKEEIISILERYHIQNPVGLIDDAIARDTPDVPAIVADSPKEFVAKWLESNGYSGTKITGLSRADVGNLDLAGEAYLRGFPRNLRPFEAKEIKIARDTLVEEYKQGRVGEVLESLVYNPDSDPGVIREVVKKVMRPTYIDREIMALGKGLGVTYDTLYTAIFTHYIWQVQRRARGIPTYMELGIIFYGGQNVGKNKFINALCSPWEDMYASLPLDTLLDSNLSYRLGYTAIMYCDELSGMGKADVEKLKERITSTDATSRMLYTQCDTKTQNRCSIMGSSNRHLASVLKDVTGMRRWAQIDCNRSGGHLDMLPQSTHQWVKEHAKEMWTSVDYAADSVLNKDINPALFCAVRDYQEMCKSNSPIENFLISKGMYPIGSNHTVKVEIESLYGMWNIYKRTSQDRQLSRVDFLRSLEELGISPCDDDQKYVKLASEQSEEVDEGSWI